MSAAPDLVEPLLGFRAWRPRDDGRLVPWSAGASAVWQPGDNVARCLAGRGHTAPGHRCTCGLYALTDAGDERLLPRHDVVGAVVAWGDVEAHRTGFRAQYARIVALAVPARCPPRHAARLDRASSLYAVPLVPAERLEEEGRRHGRPVHFDALPNRSWREEEERAGPAPSLDCDGEEGVAADEHLRVVILARMLRVALTPELAKQLESHMPIDVPDPGTVVRRGDPLVRAGEGSCAFVLGAPVGGRVVAVNQDRGVARGDFVCDIAPTNWEHEAPGVAWGPAGRRSYLATLRHAAGTGDPFRHSRATWLTAHSHVRGPADVIEGMKAARERPRFSSGEEAAAAVGAAMRAALADPQVARLCCRAKVAVAWRLHAPDADVLLDLRGPAPAVRCGEDAVGEADVVLYAAAETADEYLAGRADLPAALRRREIQTRSGLADVLRLASVTKALHAPYAAARAG